MSQICDIFLDNATTIFVACPSARDFGPRMAHFLLPIAGKGKSDWGYALVPILAPLMGAAIAALSIGVFQY
jgi:glycerol uptake facilitator protein